MGDGHAVIPQFVTSFVLSRDCRRVALGFASRRLEVRDLGGSNIPRFVAPLGRYHSLLAVAIGSRFLTISVGKHAHLVRWDGARLESVYQATGDPSMLVAAAMKSQTPLDATRTIATEDLGSTDSYDGNRFVRGCPAFGLRIFVDIFGQIVVRDAEVLSSACSLSFAKASPHGFRTARKSARCRSSAARPHPTDRRGSRRRCVRPRLGHSAGDDPHERGIPSPTATEPRLRRGALAASARRHARARALR